MRRVRDAEHTSHSDSAGITRQTGFSHTVRPAPGTDSTGSQRVHTARTASSAIATTNSGIAAVATEIPARDRLTGCLGRAPVTTATGRVTSTNPSSTTAARLNDARAGCAIVSATGRDVMSVVPGFPRRMPATHSR